MNKIDKNSIAYKKYLERYDPKSPENLKKSKLKRIERRKNWWSQNWISFLSLIIAILALIVAVFSLNFARLSYEAASSVQEVTQCESE